MIACPSVDTFTGLPTLPNPYGERYSACMARNMQIIHLLRQPALCSRCLGIAEVSSLWYGKLSKRASHSLIFPRWARVFPGEVPTEGSNHRITIWATFAAVERTHSTPLAIRTFDRRPPPHTQLGSVNCHPSNAILTSDLNIAFSSSSASERSKTCFRPSPKGVQRHRVHIEESY